MKKYLLRRDKLAIKVPGEYSSLTIEQFFARYVSAQQIITFVDNARLHDVEEMEAAFGFANEGLQLVFPRKVRADLGKNDYKYAKFSVAKGTEEAKVILIGQIDQFFKDYQRGSIKVDFTFEQLVEEAEKLV